jgi:hypothetical protein
MKLMKHMKETNVNPSDLLHGLHDLHVLHGSGFPALFLKAA